MTSVDQKLARVERLLAGQPARFSRQGTVVATWRVVAGERHGPYYSLRYRDAGRQRSLYLGSSATLAESVRQLLECRQRVRREHLALTHARIVVKASLRQHKRLWRRHLEQAGLSLKGYEIRGWKHFRVDSNRMIVDGSDDQSPSATAGSPSSAAGLTRGVRSVSWRALVSSRPDSENWLHNGDTSATEEEFTNLLTAAEGAFASDPGNVQYGHWLNAYRWEAVSRSLPQGSTVPSADALEAAPNYHIAGLTLQVSIPYLHESFSAEWKTDYEKVKHEPWRLTLPLSLEAHPIGKLTVVGTANGNEAIADLEQLCAYLNFLHDEIAQVVASPVLDQAPSWQAPEFLSPSLN